MIRDKRKAEENVNKYLKPPTMTPVIHVLTLPHRHDRHTSIITQSVEQGFALKFFFGEKAANRPDTARCITQGHKSIIRYAKENNLPYCIIAEDDCCFMAAGAFKYFMDNMPVYFDLYTGLVYAGEVNDHFRILNGMSGTMTCYVCHSRFYNVMLNDLPDTGHVDREAGNLAFKYSYYACPKIVCCQLNGFSDHMGKQMNYDAYLHGKDIYGRD